MPLYPLVQALVPNTTSLAGEAPPIAVPGFVMTSLSDHPVS